MSKYAYLSVVVLAFALTGCAGTVDAGRGEGVKAESAPSEVPVETPVAAPVEIAPTAAPIEMAGAPDVDPATPWGEAGFVSADAWFLASMDAVWMGERPSDEQLLGAATLACEQIAAGTNRDAVTVVTGDGAEHNNAKVVSYAIITLCP